MADVAVRPGRPSDADALAVVQTASWRVDHADDDALCGLTAARPQDVEPAWRQALGASSDDGPPPVLVATAQDRVVGVAVLQRVPDDAPQEAGGSPQAGREWPTAEVATLVVAPTARGQGHGSRLLAACADTTREAGLRRLVGWVVETDAPGRQFLESAGFVEAGVRRVLATPTGQVAQVLLHTGLGPAGEEEQS